jgi:hypothetical protein
MVAQQSNARNMRLPLRILAGSLGLLGTALIVACGGGGSSPGGGNTPAPSNSPVVVNSRPLTSGDSFSYAGTTTKTFVYSGVSPEPESTAVYTVAQRVSVTGPTSFGGAAAAYDLHDTETDTSPLASLGITTDTYDALVTSGSATDLITYGFTSSDTSGEAMTVTYTTAGTGNGILDELPEAKGQSWVNSGAASLKETSPGGVTSTRVTAADGSYTDTTLYPVGSIYASPGPALTQATITQNADGSGSYVFLANDGAGGANAPYVEFDFATPRPAVSGSPAEIPITVPQASPSPPAEVDVPLWYPQPLSLYTETDADTGAVSLPAACNVPGSFGTRANAIVQTISQYDTIVGTQETFSQTSYVVPVYGLACVSLNEKLQFYYDYSGQSSLANGGPSINVTATSTLPIETETIATTLGLTQGSVPAAASTTHNDTSTSISSVATTAAVRGMRVTSARTNFIALVEREKQRRKVLLLQAIRKSLGTRLQR